MPDWKAEVAARLSSLDLPAGRHAEIVEELSQHLEDRYRDLVDGGASPEDAARLARAGFQSHEALARRMAALRQSHAAAQQTPAAPTGHVAADIWQDLRQAARTFRTHPGYAATVVLTLALGLGAATAIFSVVYGVLLKPLPFRDPDRLVSLLHRGPGVNVETMNQGPGTYATYRDHQQAFEAIGAWDTSQVAITGRGDPERIDALSTTETTLAVLGVQPHRGRLFTAEDVRPGAPARTILTHGYWQRRFGGAEDAIGRMLLVDGVATEIVGVLPPSFRFLRESPALLLPMPLDAAEALRGISFDRQAIGRLKPGVGLDQANADIARMIRLLPAQYAILRLEPKVRPLADDVIGDVGHVLWTLLAAVGGVLLIACGNVANLWLVRAEGRQTEMAVRAALGASRARLARVLLSESVWLALVAGVVGVGLAEAALSVLRALAPAQLPRVDEIGVDGLVVLFAFLVSLVSGAIFGLAAVARLGDFRASTLKDGGRAGTQGPRRRRARNALVVSQVALALTLLVVSGLMVRTFLAMRQVAPGFTRPEQVQTFRLAVPGLSPGDAELARAHRAIAEHLAQVPGVEAVGISSSITMDGEDNGNPLFVEDAPTPAGTLPPLRRFKNVGPGYFETMGNPVVAGRSITWAEIEERRPVTLVSRTLAREYWPEPAQAIGKRVRSQPNGEWSEIVGVVGDERDDGLNHPATAIVYWPMFGKSYPARTLAYAVRASRVGTAGFMTDLQRAVWSVNKDVPLAAVRTVAEIQSQSMAQTSFAMTMLAIAAAMALVIGLVGTYSVVAYVAALRVREIGIRMALGARIQDVRALLLRQGLALMVTGIGLGLAIAVLLTRAMSALLFGIGPTDPVTYAVTALTVAAAGLLAIYLPARRASRVDPVAALRAESH